MVVHKPFPENIDNKKWHGIQEASEQQEMPVNENVKYNLRPRPA